MKNFLSFAILIIGVALLMVATKPSDQRCINKTVEMYTGSALLTSIGGYAGVNSLAFQVNDHVFYKTIDNRLTGRIVAIGVFDEIIQY